MSTNYPSEQEKWSKNAISTVIGPPSPAPSSTKSSTNRPRMKITYVPMPLTPSTSDAGSSSRRPSLSYETLCRHASTPLTSRKSRRFALPSPPIQPPLTPLRESPLTPPSPLNKDLLDGKSESDSHQSNSRAGQSGFSFLGGEQESLTSKGKEKVQSTQSSTSSSSCDQSSPITQTIKPKQPRRSPTWSRMKSLSVISDPDYPSTPACLSQQYAYKRKPGVRKEPLSTVAAFGRVGDVADVFGPVREYSRDPPTSRGYIKDLYEKWETVSSRSSVVRTRRMITYEEEDISDDCEQEEEASKEAFSAITSSDEQVPDLGSSDSGNSLASSFAETLLSDSPPFIHKAGDPPIKSTSMEFPSILLNP